MGKTSRDLQAELSKRRIYDAGIELFSEYGFDQTSVSDICRKAGCSVGAFYHHFSSKENILEETFRIADEQFNERNRNREVAPATRDAVIQYMEEYATLVVSSGLEFTKRFYTWKNKVFIREGRPMQTGLVDLLRRCTEHDEIALTVSPEEACEWIFVCARGVVFHWCLHEGSFDLVARMRDAITRVLSGIERRPTS